MSSSAPPEGATTDPGCPVLGFLLKPVRVPAPLFAAPPALIGYIIATQPVTKMEALVVTGTSLPAVALTLSLCAAMFRRNPQLLADARRELRLARSLPFPRRAWHMFGTIPMPLSFVIALSSGMIYAILELIFPSLPR